MTQQDRTEIKELIAEHLENVTAKTDSKFEIIVYKLDMVIEQTTKTNGRVNKLEEKEMMHVVNCPQTIKIRELEDNQLSTKSIKTWLASAVLITGALFAVIIEIFKFIK